MVRHLLAKGAWLVLLSALAGCGGGGGGTGSTAGSSLVVVPGTPALTLGTARWLKNGTAREYKVYFVFDTPRQPDPETVSVFTFTGVPKQGTFVEGSLYFGLEKPTTVPVTATVSATTPHPWAKGWDAQDTEYNATAGTIRVTQFSSTACAGTFSFTLTDKKTNTKTISITDGQFYAKQGITPDGQRARSSAIPVAFPAPSGLLLVALTALHRPFLPGTVRRTRAVRDPAGSPPARSSGHTDPHRGTAPRRGEIMAVT